MEQHLFTPRSQDNRERLAWHISSDDLEAIGGRYPHRCIITNLDTGKRYLVRTAACCFPHCFCDARIVKEVRS